MSTLFELNKAIQEFDLIVDEETGEVLNIDELDALNLAKNEKIENVCLWYKNVSAEAEMVKAEAKNMTERAKRLENKAESLKKYLAYALQGEKFSTPKVAVSYRKSESVNIPDEMLIPDRYCNVSVVRKPDKTLIKKALKEGKEVKGAELVTKQNISIK